MNDHRKPNRGAARAAAGEAASAATSHAERQLIDYLSERRSRRCRRMLERADAEADEMRRQARRRASLVVREGIRQERIRRAAAIRQERARIEAELRKQRFLHERAELKHARERLEAQLDRRWRDDVAARRAWLRMSCKQGLAFLPDGNWELVHPPGWDRAEAARLLGALERLRPDIALSFVEGEQAAGVILRCGMAVVDTRPEGLLAERAWIDGLLLYALETDGAADPAAGRAES